MKVNIHSNVWEVSPRRIKIEWMYNFFQTATRKSLPRTRLQTLSPMVSSRNVSVLSFTVNLWYIWVHFVYVVRQKSKFFFFFHICACSITSVVSQLFVTLWTVAPQAPLSMRFSRQEYWSGLPRPPPGCLPNPGIEPAFPVLQVDSLLLNHWGSTPFYLHLAT